MNLKKYIAWRVVHMIVTMIIVIVLLFLLFRLMPGSAASELMLQPGMTEEAKHQELVRLGFEKWVAYPGSYYVGTYRTSEPGEYTFTVTAFDKNGYNNSNSTTVLVRTDPDKDYAPPQITSVAVTPTNPDVNTTATISIGVHDAIAINRISIEIHKNMSTQGLSMPLQLSPSGTTGDLALVIDTPGPYYGIIRAQDLNGNEATAYLGFSTNGTGAPPSMYYITSSQPVATVGTSSTISVIYTGNMTPTLALISPNRAITSQAMNSAGNNSYYLDITPSTAGFNTINITDGSINCMMRLVVNPSNPLALNAPPAGSSTTQPAIDNFKVERDDLGKTIYPYPLLNKSGITLRANVTISANNGFANLTCMVVPPSGEATQLKSMAHPVYALKTELWEQFGTYMVQMMTLNFGTSFKNNQPVMEKMAERIPPTLLLFGTTLITETVFGIAIGVILAWRRGSAMEIGTIVVTLFFWSMPIFWSALIAQWIFFLNTGHLQTGMTGFDQATGQGYQGLQYVWDLMSHLALPMLVLTVLHLAGTILLMRTSMMEVMGEDYITTARAKGLKERTVIYKHAARNAMLPIVTNLALSISGVISGGVLTETIFSWPGMGSLLVTATLDKDFPVVQAAFTILAFLTILGNMLADILYAYLDPRVQL